MGVSFFRESMPLAFGSFELSFQNMFLVLMGQFWAPGMDPLDENCVWYHAYCINVINTVFMFSYFLVIVCVLLQVSVAVLIDNFISATVDMEQERVAIETEIIKRREQVQNTLDPLLEELTRSYVDDEDLTRRLDSLFEVVDTDGSGEVTFEELCCEMKKLDFSPPIHLTESDFAIFTQVQT